jgi:hypothetical protein
MKCGQKLICLSETGEILNLTLLQNAETLVENKMTPEFCHLSIPDVSRFSRKSIYENKPFY